MRSLLPLVRFVRLRPELLILTLAGFWLRLAGVYPGYFAHGDEQIYGEAVYMILNKTLGMEPQFLYYPPLVAWVTSIFFLVLFIPGTILLHFPELLATDFDQILLSNFFHQVVLGPTWVNAMYWGRYVTVAFGTAVVALTYIIADRMFKSRLISFLSTTFVCLNYRLVLNSQIGFLDMYNAFFLLILILSVVILLEKPSLKSYLIAWVSVALLFLVKYQFYGLIPLIVAHTNISLKQSARSLRRFITLFLRKEFLIGGLLALCIVLIAHYYHFQHFKKVVEFHQYQALKYSIGKNSLNIFPISYWYHVGIGPLLTWLSLGGIITGLLVRGYRIVSVLLLAALLPIAYIYLYYSGGGFYTRNFLAAIPLLSIFASLFLYVLFHRIADQQRQRISQFIGLTVLILLVAISSNEHIKNVSITTQILSKESNITVAQRWLDKHIPLKTTFAGYYARPAPTSEGIKTQILDGVGWAYSYPELLFEGVDYILIDFHIVNSQLVWWMNQPTDIGLKFWNKPDGLLSQNFFSLATRELLWHNTIQAFLPTWQIPGYNYAVVKIDPKLKSKFKLMLTYSFTEGDDNWNKLYFFPQLERLLKHTQTGNDDTGSLTIEAEWKETRPKKEYFLPGTGRWESPPIEAKGLFGYKIVAWIKNSDFTEKKDRNGFIRLNFYTETPDQTVTTKPLISFVSERVFGQPDWHKVEIFAIAPIHSKFLTISFQADRPKADYYLDNIELHVTELQILEKENPHLTIPDQDFFPPNDGGFL